MNSEIREFDVVRVVRLKSPVRGFIGSDGIAREPRVGDAGTVVRDYGSLGVCVECSDKDGHCVWLADFDRDELALEWRAPPAEKPRSKWRRIFR